MIDCKLKFPNEAIGRKLLGEVLHANSLDEDGNTVLDCFTHKHAIAIRGVLFEETEDGPRAIAGWHADLRLLVAAAIPQPLTEYIVTPAKPFFEWAE